MKLPISIVNIIFQLMSDLFNQARYPFEVACINPCKTIAGPTERKLINIPIRIKPPNIPKIEDKNAVAKVAMRINNKIKSISIYYLIWQEICNTSSFYF